ncbi:MAG: hypothetical protein R3F33_05765 [Planctomycetota bacterium]
MTPKIAALLATLPEGASGPALLDRLRRELEPELAREVAALHESRQRSKARLGLDLLPFLRSGSASQCTAPAIARHRARTILERSGASHIWDATCGLGMEAICLALAGHSVIASDHNLETACFARANLRSHGLETPVIVADGAGDAVAFEYVLLDPDRRPNGQRTLDAEKWSPAWSRCLAQAARARGAAIKLPPTWKPGPEAPEGAEWHWISTPQGLLECTLWLGAWATQPGHHALRLPAEGDPIHYHARPTRVEALDPAEAQQPAFLYDPDPALIAADLLGSLAAETGLAPLAPELGYLAGPRRVEHGLLRGFEVLDACSFKPKLVRAMLGAHGIGPVRVRLRGHQEAPEVLAQRFRGPGKGTGELAVARLDAGRRVYLIRPLG